MTLRQRQPPVGTTTTNPKRTTTTTTQKNGDDKDATMENLLLDEDEQDIMIQQIQNDYIQQSLRLEMIFTILCRYIVPLLSFFYTILLIDQESKRNITTKPHNQPILHTLRWIHLILNGIIHWFIPKGIFRKISPEHQSSVNTNQGTMETVSLVLRYGVYIPYGVTWFLTAVAHWMIRQQQSQHIPSTMTMTIGVMYHWILCMTVTLFLLSAVYIQHDHHDVLYHHIHDLQSNKYSYKSL